jgi:ABC-type Fe3+-hydroxamate transport system substrate-binding protein
MPLFTDQMNRTINIPEQPQRIISLVPSQTELLVELGLEDRLVGLTKFCVHPKGLKKSKTIIGGTKNFRFEKIEALRPDLIIGNKEENYQEGIERLAKTYPVWLSDISNLEDAFKMILEIGKITGTSIEAIKCIDQLRKDFDQLSIFKGTAIYMIWKDPMMVAGKATFIDDMLLRSGFKNIIDQKRYPELTMEDLLKLSPDYLLLSSEPYPFKESHLDEFQKLLPQTKVLLVNGEMFSWYGSRLKHFVSYSKTL